MRETLTILTSGKLMSEFEDLTPALSLSLLLYASYPDHLTPSCQVRHETENPQDHYESGHTSAAAFFICR